MNSPVTIEFTVNDEECCLPRGTTVADVVARWCQSSRGVAVAVNLEVVPKSTWAHVLLCEADRVEIVSASAGG